MRRISWSVKQKTQPLKNKEGQRSGFNLHSHPPRDRRQQAMSSTRESREVKDADLPLKTPNKSDAIRTSTTIEQPGDEQYHQANITGAATENTSSPPLITSSSEIHHDQPGQDAECIERSHKEIEAPMATASGAYPFLFELPLRPAKSKKTDADGIEAPIVTTSGENPCFIKLYLPPAKCKRADDGGIEAAMAITSGENPHFPKILLTLAKSKKTGDHGIETPKVTAPGENLYSLQSLPTTQSEKTGDKTSTATATGENPYLSTLPLPTTQSESTSGEGTQALQWSASGKNFSLSTLPRTSSEAAWQSSQAAWQSIKRKEKNAKIAQTSALPLTSSEAAWRSGKVAQQSTKRGEQTAKIAQTSTLALTSSEAACWSGTVARQLKRGEQIAKIAQTSTVALISSEAAWQSSKIAWQSIEGKEKAARIVRTRKQIDASSTKASRRDIGAIVIGQPDPKVRKQPAENQTLSRSSPPIVAPAPQDNSSQPIPPTRTFNELVVTNPTAEDGKSFRYFSHVNIPVKCQNFRVQHQTVILPPRRKCAPSESPVNRRNVRAKHQTVIPPLRRNCAIPATEGKSDVSSYNDISETCSAARVRPQTLRLICKRSFVATPDDGNDPATAQREQPSSSQQSQPPIPSPDSKIQKIPTKDHASQYYSHQAYGGWRVLNARDAAIEIEKEDWKKAWTAQKRTAEGKLKEVAEISRDEKSNRGGSGLQNPSPQPSVTRPPTSDGIKSKNPPAKRRRTDYEGLISCRPSDKFWKNWENKLLLRSHAAGLSFAQISALREFSNGLVIRSGNECHERYKVLKEWQPFQDEQLLHAGKSGANEDFAQVCSVNFSKGLVKRSAGQCRERFEFLRNSEFEGS